MQNNENQVPCMKVFLSLNKYHNHQRTHTNEFPYKCKVDGCHAKFNQKGNFITHLKSIHQIFDSDIWINQYFFTKIKILLLKVLFICFFPYKNCFICFWRALAPIHSLKGYDSNETQSNKFVWKESISLIFTKKYDDNHYDNWFRDTHQILYYQ